MEKFIKVLEHNSKHSKGKCYVVLGKVKIVWECFGMLENALEHIE
jgi:hypothetical protein